MLSPSSIPPLGIHIQAATYESTSLCKLQLSRVSSLPADTSKIFYAKGLYGVPLIYLAELLRLQLPLSTGYGLNITYDYPYNKETVRAMAYHVLECESWLDDLCTRPYETLAPSWKVETEYLCGLLTAGSPRIHGQAAHASRSRDCFTCEQTTARFRRNWVQDRHRAAYPNNLPSNDSHSIINDFVMKLSCLLPQNTAIRRTSDVLGNCQFNTYTAESAC